MILRLILCLVAAIVAGPPSASAVDATPPADGTVVVTAGISKQLTLTWSGFSDVGGTGIAGYLARFQTGATVPASCGVGTPVPGYAGTGTTLTHTGLTDGTVYSYRICAIDGAGNISSGATASGRPPEMNPPTGQVTINGGDAVTRSTAATLLITASDSSLSLDPTIPAIQMCVSNTAACTSWAAYSGMWMTKSWTLASGSGVKTVNVWFRDKWGNTSATPVSDTILLDTTKPQDGTVVVTAGVSGQLTLDWGGFADPGGSGIASYVARFQAGTSAPASCTAGAPVPDYAGTATTLTHTGLTDGTTYSYRICAVDAVGNVSSGATRSAKSVPETTPPTGTVVINGGAAATKSTASTLAITAADDTAGAIQMCVSNAATCSSWTALAATKSWTLASGSGVKTVNVWLRDSWGNASATPVSDTIVLDTGAPTNGTVTVTPGNEELTVDWSGFADPGGSGVASYRVKFLAGTTAPASCTDPLLYAGPLTTFTHGGLVNGTTYSYRICAVDTAGNVSAGATRSGKPNHAGTIQLSSPTYAVDESGSTVTISATRVGGSGSAVGVSYATSSGTATAGEDFTAASGTLSWGQGDNSAKTFTVSIANDALDEPDETFTVTLSAPTGGATLGTPAAATVTVVDEDPPPTVRFAQAASSGAESTTPAVIEAVLSAASGRTVTVSYATANGTATAGTDYTAASGTLTFTPGQTSRTISVPILNNMIEEPDETFTVTLTNPANAILGALSTHTYTINDEDHYGAVKLSAAAYSVGEAETTVTITAARTSGSSGAVGVSWATSDGTAAAGSDYVAATGTLSWGDGDAANKTFTVTILNDALVEMNETFTVTLSAPTGGVTLGTPGAATVTINDDDPPAVRFSQAASSGPETSTPAVIDVVLSAASGRTVTVIYATANGSATAGSDFTATSGTLTFAPGVTSRSISVPIHTDADVESDETFTVTLSAPGNATLGAPATHTRTIVNANSPPVLSPIGNRSVAEGALLQFTVQGTDPNGDPLTFSASGLPAGATFDPPTRVFSWTPNYVQSGSYPVTISVTDGMDTDSETFTITVTQANPTFCEGCHNASAYDPDGAGPAPAAPNVMGNGVLAGGKTAHTTPKPYDDGTYGYNVNGHGRDNDTYASSRGNAIGLACTACHDISQPPGTHLDGVLNGRLSPDTRNANSFHLNSSFISASSPSSQWDVQVRFDNACYSGGGNACHKNKTNDMRHGMVDNNPAPNARQYGAPNLDGVPVSRNAPSNTPPPNMYYDMHLRTLGAYDGTPNFLLCISCHDPHGTSVVPDSRAEPSGNNRMALYPWAYPSSLCAKCH